MRVVEAIEKSKKPLFTFEILPPVKGSDIHSIYRAIDPLMEFEPSFIEVTYHREEISYKELPDGNIEKKVLRKRPGTVGISAAIKYKYKIEVVPHIICGGFNREETENGLIDLHFLEIYNLLAIRGDNLPGEKFFKPEKGGNQYTLDLIRQIRELNQGIYQDKELVNNAPTNFSVGVAGYPEKHAEAPNMKTDIKHLKEKIDAGGEYIVTQMFFDNRFYFDFVRQCREAGIKVPIIPGLKPISTIGQLNTLPRTFNISIPEELQKEVEKCKDNRGARQVGIEWCKMQSKELMNTNVPALHYFTMGKSDNIKEIVREVL
ncbi:MAG: methylenetetrahydrofolate reductase [NAD(P)H] [Deltaproteobacteria bacterium]|nr:MAG: methylenetetrahydrofolate reductase [NAD(P)H] [Deltaproteobacteria bacterium]